MITGIDSNFVKNHINLIDYLIANQSIGKPEVYKNTYWKLAGVKFTKEKAKIDDVNIN